MTHTKESLLAAWKNRPLGVGSRDTSDPILLAGCYLEWASGDLSKAVHAVKVHASDQYLDMPAFPGCHETISILESLTP